MHEIIMNKRTTFSSLKRNELRNIKNVPLLKAISGKNVSIYAVTALANFAFEKELLQQYSKLLTNRVSKKMSGCVVEFDTLKGMAYSLPALTVKVLKNNKIRYESLVLTLADSNEIYGKTTSLPVLCVFKEAGAPVTKIIHCSLEKMFSCCIRPCCVSNIKFLWLTGIGINESLMRKANEGVNIAFSLPEFSQQSQIHIHLTEESLENLWLCSREDPASSVLTLDEIQSFFHGLLEHIKKTYGFNLEECSLKSVKMEGIKFLSGKKLQMFISSEEIAYLILSFLQSDCGG
ncbi:uncharacterized protein isoform X2 [Rhodnius prolixus]|uniref:uncharacterized protein isoform X2 n=1 Tax=Rhodnius prolixus TaxID=13249 RepID=UPI003D18F050